MVTYEMFNDLLNDKTFNTFFGRSKWEQGIKEYVREILEYANFDDEDEFNQLTLHKKLLNGATNWTEYSEGGCSLIYDNDIIERLTPPGSVERVKRYNNNHQSGTWCINDLQVRALVNAWFKISKMYKFLDTHDRYQWVTYNVWGNPHDEEGWQVNDVCKTDIYLYIPKDCPDKEILKRLRGPVFKETCRCIEIDDSNIGEYFIEIQRRKDGYPFGRLEYVYIY